MTDATPSTGDTRNAPVHILAHLTKNFAVLSSAAVAISSLAASLFLYAYLSVFDWRLIWIIEYSDILKTGLIGVTVILGVALFTVYAWASDGYRWFTEKNTRSGMWFPIVLWAIGLILWMWREYTSPQPHYMLVFMSFMAPGQIVACVVVITRIFRSARSVRLVFKDIFVLICAISAFGTTFGLYSRDVPFVKHDFIFKTSEVQNAVLVLFTPHHLVLYQDERTIVVPAADLVRIESRARPKQ